MKKLNKLNERQVLLISAFGALGIGLTGIVFASISDSQAILLDGLFNFSYFFAGLLTLKVAKLLLKGDDEKYHFGYSYYEPLINGLKGVMILVVSIMALVGAVDALFKGGRTIEPGPAIIYGIIATGACTFLAIVTRSTRLHISSPLIDADAKSWMINAAISSAVMLAFICIFLIQGTTLDFLIPYIDPILVLIIVTISISIPIRMAYMALMELLNRAPSTEVIEEVQSAIEEKTGDLPIKNMSIRIIQPGRNRYVLVHLILPPDLTIEKVSMLDDIRQETLTELEKIYKPVMLDMIFTSDEKLYVLN